MPMTNEAIRDISEEVTREDMRAVREIELALAEKRRRAQAVASAFRTSDQKIAERTATKGRSAAYRALQKKPAIESNEFYDVVDKGGMDNGNRWRIMRGASTGELSIQHIDCGSVSFNEQEIVKRACSKCAKYLGFNRFDWKP